MREAALLIETRKEREIDDKSSVYFILLAEKRSVAQRDVTRVRTSPAVEISYIPSYTTRQSRAAVGETKLHTASLHTAKERKREKDGD